MENSSELDPNQASNFKPYLVFTILFLVVLFAYWQSFATMFSEWLDNSLYTHSWLSSAIFFYGIWDARKKPVLTRKMPLLGVLVLIAGSALWWLGVIVSIAFFQHVSLFMFVVGLVWVVWGWDMIWSHRYLFVVLALSIPVWQVFQHPLRYMSTEVSYSMLKFINVPVLLEGYTMTVPGGRFHVEPACAGLSFLLASTSLVFVYGAWHNSSIKQIFLLLLLSAAVAIIANWIRILIIIIVGNHTNMQSPIVEDHLTFGWILFVCIYGPVFWLAIRKLDIGEGSVHTQIDASTSKLNLSLPLVSGLLLLLFPVIHAGFASAYPNDYQSKLVDTRTADGLLIKENNQSVDWEPEFVGATTEGFKEVQYKLNRGILYLAEYPYQTQEAELINVNNRLFNKWVWKKVDEVNLDGITIINLESRGGKNRLIAYSYIVAGKRVAGEKAAKLMQLKGYFSRNNSAYGIALLLDASSFKQAENPQESAKIMLEKSIRALGLTSG